MTTPEDVVSVLVRLPGPVAAVYEAGPTGFGLARIARTRGIDVARLQRPQRKGREPASVNRPVRCQPP
jgi:hypothetical protein